MPQNSKFKQKAATKLGLEMVLMDSEGYPLYIQTEHPENEDCSVDLARENIFSTIQGKY